MTEQNLFTMLSAYRPGTTATPFENYCTSALAYFLGRGHRELVELFAGRAGAPGKQVVSTAVQQQVAVAGYADLTIEFSGGLLAICEVQVEPGATGPALETVAESAGRWDEHPAFILVCLDGSAATAPWTPITWTEIAAALRAHDDELAREFADFIQRDILGGGSVPLDQAVTTNRLYALGAAAVRRRFGEQARYVNSASRPIGGRYRYLGTTFAVDAGEMAYWVGLVNEGLPLSDHYYLMLASKEQPLERRSDQPRATADWKWAHWTTHGRVVRPITSEMYDELLRRIPL